VVGTASGKTPVIATQSTGSGTSQARVVVSAAPLAPPKLVPVRVAPPPPVPVTVLAPGPQVAAVAVPAPLAPPALPVAPAIVPIALVAIHQPVIGLQTAPLATQGPRHRTIEVQAGDSETFAVHDGGPQLREAGVGNPPSTLVIRSKASTYTQRRKQRADTGEVSGELYHYLRRRVYLAARTEETIHQLRKEAEQWLRTHHPDWTEADKTSVFEPAIRAAMFCSEEEEQTRQAWKAGTTNRYMGKVSAAAKGDLGRRGVLFWRKQVRLPKAGAKPS
jgi:hypothetical protein